MPSTFFGLDIGASGLNIYQTALNVTLHNIANSGTEGYTKQVLNRKAKEAISLRSTYGMVGTGVTADKISQVRDSYFDNKYRSANSTLGKLDQRSYYLKQVENYFNEVDDNGSLRSSLTSFFNSMDEVQKDPTSLAARNQFVEAGMTVTDYFNNLAGNLEKLQDSINSAIKADIDRINSYGEQLATLNKQINTIEVNGGFANDLRDQRNLIIDKLSKICNVKVTETSIIDKKDLDKLPENFNNARALNVRINGRDLVDVYSFNKIVAVPRDRNLNNTDIDGLCDFTWQDGQTFDLRNVSLGGELQGMVEMRDGNNAGNFKAEGQEVKEGGTEIVVGGAGKKSSNINSVDLMNMPPQGYIKVNGKKYEYISFTVDTSTEGNYKYTFKLKPGEKISRDDNKAKIEIGNSVKYKGIPYYMDRINQFVRTFARNVNEQHKKGQDLNEDHGLDFFNAKDKVTGYNYVFDGPDTKFTTEAEDKLKTSGMDDAAIGNAKTIVSSSGDVKFSGTDNAFVLGSYYLLTAKNCTVTAAIKKDPRRIAAAKDLAITQKNVENTENIKAMQKLRDMAEMFDEGKPEEFVQSLISDIGVDTKASQTVSENQDKIVTNIDTQRISISGVDRDEETVDLVKFQQAYNLSAHVVSVMNQIYNTLINQMAV